jgi:hypothetical protein
LQSSASARYHIFLPPIFLLSKSSSRKMGGRKMLNLCPCPVKNREYGVAEVIAFEATKQPDTRTCVVAIYIGCVLTIQQRRCV